MKTRSHWTLELLAIVVSLWLLFNPAKADDYWSSWRARQRAELAALPKPPAPPPGEGLAIDRMLPGDGAPVDDAAFARRVYLGVIGLLPTVEQLEQFVSDTRSDKRAKLVDALLADKQGYAEHWMTLWN